MHTPRTLSDFQVKYSDEQREACVSAVLDRGTSAAEVARMAQRGELPGKDGPLKPFKIPASSVRSHVRKVRERRLGLRASRLSDLEHRDAVEALRRRFVNMIDGELTVEERKRQGNRDPERIRQLGRAMREVAAIPGPKDPRPAAPGAKTNGKRDGGQTEGGMAGDLLRAHRTAQGSTAQDETHNGQGSTENGAAHDAARRTNGAAETHADDRPGSDARAIARPAPIAA